MGTCFLKQCSFNKGSSVQQVSSHIPTFKYRIVILNFPHNQILYIQEGFRQEQQFLQQKILKKLSQFQIRMYEMWINNIVFCEVKDMKTTLKQHEHYTPSQDDRTRQGPNL